MRTRALVAALVAAVASGAAAGATTPDLAALRAAERAAFLRDASTHGVVGALSSAAVRRAERFRASVASGRLTAGPTVQTIYGSVTGITGGNVTQYLGVPFAAQPIGNARWRAPGKPAPWGAINATWFGPTCPQTEANTWAIFTGTDEGCLNLNIYAPSKAPPPGGFPVMLFWYGGSFTYGSAGFPLYDGFFDVALLSDTIIVVRAALAMRRPRAERATAAPTPTHAPHNPQPQASNYRLGLLGFLAGDALRAESPDHSVGTYGTQDQRAALQFIRDTIAPFGGDPSRVTIFGQSAGAASVAAHLVSPRSRGLFSGAIIESGAFSPWTAQPYNISSLRLAEFAKNVGCGAADLACMRAVNASEVLKADRGLTKAFLEWSPTIDGVEILDDPRALLASGNIADVPVLLGFNSDEGTMFAPGPKDLNASGYISAIATILPLAQAELVAAQYPCADYEADLGQSACWWAIAALIRDSMFVCPAQTTASTLTALPRNSSGQTFAYMYSQILAIVEIVDLFKPYRVFHGSELLSVFDLWPGLIGEGEAAMGRWFATSWTSFAATGNPNFAGAPAWPAFGANNVTVAISTGADGVVLERLPSFARDACAFWAANPIEAGVVWGGGT